MPSRAPRVCVNAGCPNLTTDGARCVEHRREKQNADARIYRNPAKQAVYRSPRWQGIRRAQLRDKPWCETEGCTSAATEVDHVDGFTDVNDPRAWDRTRMRSLCKPCHSSITIRTWRNL